MAEANNKSYADVKTAVRNAAKAELDAAVKDNRLTQAQADRILARLSARLDDGGRFRGRHRHGP